MCYYFRKGWFSYVNISVVSPVLQDCGSGLTVWSHLYYELLRDKLSNKFIIKMNPVLCLLIHSTLRVSRFIKVYLYKFVILRAAQITYIFVSTLFCDLNWNLLLYICSSKAKGRGLLVEKTLLSFSQWYCYFCACSLFQFSWLYSTTLDYTGVEMSPKLGIHV